MQHFGLETQPFRAVAQGDWVFVGPRQARALANLKIALAMPDAIAVLAGPVGVGKTTLVGRVLNLVAAKRATARVGRTPMTVDEMLEHLLAEFGISGSGPGRMERLRTLRNYFKDCGATGVRAFILVEDAKALDIKLLAELESVTAADANGSPGANIVLMGPAAVTDLIDAPELEHLRQRTRLRQQLETLNTGEIAGYVKHQLEMAGGDFEAIVDPQTPRTLRHCTGGIPRIVNNLCETALTVAATNKMASLMPHLVQRVAVTIYGIQPRAADGQSARIVPTQSMALPAAAIDSPVAEPSTQPATAVADDPEPTIVEEDLPEEMLEAAEALADFQPAHPAEVTQDITDLPAAPDTTDADVAADRGELEASEPAFLETADAPLLDAEEPPHAFEAPMPAPSLPAAQPMGESAQAVTAESPESAWEAAATDAPVDADDSMPSQHNASVAAVDEPADEAMLDGDWALITGMLELEAATVPAEPPSILSGWEPEPQEPELQLAAAATPRSLENDWAAAAHPADPEPETAEVVLTESTRIKTLSVLDELADMEVAPASPEPGQLDAPPERSQAARSAGIDWTTWPLAADDGNPAPQGVSEPMPTIDAQPDLNQIEMATPAALARPTARPDPILAPVVGPGAAPVQPMWAPAQANAQPPAMPPATPPATPLARPSEPPTLTNVQPEPPMAATTSPEASNAQEQPVPPVLTEVFQVTPRQPLPAARPGTPIFPGPIVQPAGAATPANPPAAPSATAPVESPALPGDLDFSVLLASSDTDESDGPDHQGSDVPVLIDPPALTPVDRDLQQLASQVAQVTNLADLDELLAETLFGDAELEHLSSEIQARQESAKPPIGTNPAATSSGGAQPASPPNGTDTTKIERMAILAAMNGLGNQDDDESEQKNAVG